MQPLNACNQGDRVTIVRIRGTGALRKRLIELGFLKGKMLDIIKYAPLRDPMEVKLGDSFISLRTGEAANIDVMSTPGV
jgi:Fe2+ transport system protein FeoA